MAGSTRPWSGRPTMSIPSETSATLRPSNIFKRASSSPSEYHVVSMKLYPDFISEGSARWAKVAAGRISSNQQNAFFDFIFI